MIRAAAMRLIELMIHKEDIKTVLKYLSEFGEFQFQDNLKNLSVDDKSANLKENPDLAVFNQLEKVRSSLDIADLTEYTESVSLPTEEERSAVKKLVAVVEELHNRELKAIDELNHVNEAYNEVKAFSNLKVPYSQMESLSFLTLRIGELDSSQYDLLKFSLGDRAILSKLGDDGTRILVACSKDARLFVDNELEKYGFVKVEVPKDFNGVPENAIAKLKEDKVEKEKLLKDIQEERINFAAVHKDSLYHLLQVFSVSSQICAVENSLESTQLVFRLTGWIPATRTDEFTSKIDELTEKRSGIRNFLPEEVASVISGQEKVPTELKHGKLISNFKRMIFSYGSPLYGTIDPTPFVAVFFTLLFGIMFGDAGQGLVFLLVGILMTMKVFKLGGWEKFNLIFIAIGISSTIMGLLTGEFFASETILEPFERFVTGLFGEPRNQILPMMPTSDPQSIKRMFMFFGFTVGVGFIINTVGLVINIINQFSLRRIGNALFGKIGLSGALFFWYVVAFALRIAFGGHKPVLYDWLIIGITLGLSAFSEPLARLVDGERPILENGVFAAIIGAVVEIIEVLSSYLSNSVSFLRVGAFALAHAVLGFIISMLVGVTPFPFGILVSILGNAIVIVLEGMIVSIQVVRLQYYEFFSKFFSETGREFKPFVIKYTGLNVK